MSTTPWTVSLKRCARCGEAHTDILLQPFTQRAEQWTHWALCPTTGEPILVREESSFWEATAKGAQPGLRLGI